MDAYVLLLLILEAALGLLLLHRAGLLKTPGAMLVAVLLLALAFTLRGMLFDFETLDYKNFLSRWAAYFREYGGFRALSEQVGNYNIPYLYFLAACSYLPIRDLYLIKLLSCLFDVLLAWGAMLLCRIFTQKPARLLACFFTVLLLPTVVLNGACWGQCDSIYVSLGILGVYLALRDKPVGSMILMALSFSVKLQAVFLLPVCAVLWMYKKYSWKHFLIFPAAYILLVLPAVALGRPFLETITLYFSQTGSIGDGLNYNSSSIFSIFWRIPPEQQKAAAGIGIAAAAVYMLNILAVAYANRSKLSDRSILGAALLFVIGIPFLLPHMHERYFYFVDVLTVLLAYVAPPYLAAALLAQFSSLIGYHVYLMNLRYYVIQPRYGAAALLVVFALSLIFFLRSLREPPARGKSAGKKRKKNSS